MKNAAMRESAPDDRRAEGAIGGAKFSSRTSPGWAGAHAALFRRTNSAAFVTHL
jgi:hypothetical protein